MKKILRRCHKMILIRFIILIFCCQLILILFIFLSVRIEKATHHSCCTIHVKITPSHKRRGRGFNRIKSCEILLFLTLYMDKNGASTESARGLFQKMKGHAVSHQLPKIDNADPATTSKIIDAMTTMAPTINPINERTNPAVLTALLFPSALD